MAMPMGTRTSSPWVVNTDSVAAASTSTSSLRPAMFHLPEHLVGPLIIAACAAGALSTALDWGHLWHISVYSPEHYYETAGLIQEPNLKELSRPDHAIEKKGVKNTEEAMRY